MSGFRWASRLTVFFDADGVTPAAAGLIHFYDTGTSTPLPTYSDDGLMTENVNPIELDEDGRLPVDVFLDPLETYRVVQADPDDVPIAEDDPTAGSDIAGAIAAHNADPDAHLDASETQRGMVELANDAEAIAKTRTDAALTPANLAAIGATETFAGLVEKATDAETVTGTDDVRYTSPKNIQALNAAAAAILTASGQTLLMGAYQFSQNFSGSASALQWKFPGGYRIEIGTGDSSLGASQNFNFAVAFSSYCTAVFATRNDAGAQSILPVTAKTTTNFTIDRDGSDGTTPFTYVAFGK